MRFFGVILIIIAVCVIFYNTVIIPKENKQIANQKPFETFFSAGSNLKRRYTFTPPFTGFEIFIFAIGIGGIAMCIFAPTPKSED